MKNIAQISLVLYLLLEICGARLLTFPGRKGRLRNGSPIAKYHPENHDVRPDGHNGNIRRPQRSGNSYGDEELHSSVSHERPNIRNRRNRKPHGDSHDFKASWSDTSSEYERHPVRRVPQNSEFSTHFGRDHDRKSYHMRIHQSPHIHKRRNHYKKPQHHEGQNDAGYSSIFRSRSHGQRQKKGYNRDRKKATIQSSSSSSDEESQSSEEPRNSFEAWFPQASNVHSESGSNSMETPFRNSRHNLKHYARKGIRYNHRGSVSDERGIRYKNRGSMSEKKPIRKNNRESMSEEKPTRIKNRGSVSDERAVRYNNRGSVSDERVVRYNNRGSVSDERVVRYRNRGSMSEEKPTRHKNRGSVSDERGVRYKNRGSAGDEKPVRKNNRGHVNRKKVIGNNNRESVIKEKEIQNIPVVTVDLRPQDLSRKMPGRNAISGSIISTDRSISNGEESATYSSTTENDLPETTEIITVKPKIGIKAIKANGILKPNKPKDSAKLPKKN